MILKGIELSQILVIANFVVAFLLLAYGFYLGTLEKKLRNKEDQMDTFASEIIKEANVKALNILKDSKYLSDSLKKEIEDNFELLLDNLKSEGEVFYKQVEQEFVKSSNTFAEKLEQRAENEIEDFSTRVTFSADNARKDFEQKYSAEYSKAMAELEQFKEAQKTQFQKEMSAKIDEIAKTLIPLGISIEDHEKLVKEAIEKAYKENVFEG